MSRELEHRRTRELFELSDVRITSSFNLEWPDEESSEHRTTKPRRSLAAKARIPERLRVNMYLGVPEDKQPVKYDDESRIDYIPIYIQEETESTAMYRDDIPDLAKHGSIHYTNYSSFPSDTSAILIVPPETFDKIEQLAEKPGIAFEILLHLHCWQRSGWEGTDQIYINTDGDSSHTPAQLVEVRVSKVFPEQTVMDLRDSMMVDELDNEGVVPPPGIPDLQKQIVGLWKQLESIKAAAVWSVILLGVISVGVLL